MTRTDDITEAKRDLRTFKGITIFLFIALGCCLLVGGLSFLLYRLNQANSNTEVLNVFFEIISLGSNLFSLILAIVAIWITFYFKEESDRINSKTLDLLSEVKTEAKSMASVVLPELEKYGSTSREILKSSQTNETVLLALKQMQNVLNEVKGKGEIL